MQATQLVSISDRFFARNFILEVANTETFKTNKEHVPGGGGAR